MDGVENINCCSFATNRNSGVAKTTVLKKKKKKESCRSPRAASGGKEKCLPELNGKIKMFVRNKTPSPKTKNKT
jgi:hypothetical protein